MTRRHTALLLALAGIALAIVHACDAPTVPPLKVFADMDVCGDTAESPVLQIDPKTKGLRFVLVYLEKVEKGKAPDSIPAAHLTNGQPDRSRILCPYPQVATYKGSGDTNDAANFSCKEDKIEREGL